MLRVLDTSAVFIFGLRPARSFVVRVAGWIPVGTTQVCGRYDRFKRFDKPQKRHLVAPLGKRLETQTESV